MAICGLAEGSCATCGLETSGQVLFPEAYPSRPGTTIRSNHSPSSWLESTSPHSGQASTLARLSHSACLLDGVNASSASTSASQEALGREQGSSRRTHVGKPVRPSCLLCKARPCLSMLGPTMASWTLPQLCHMSNLGYYIPWKLSTNSITERLRLEHNDQRGCLQLSRAPPEP